MNNSTLFSNDSNQVRHHEKLNRTRINHVNKPTSGSSSPSMSSWSTPYLICCLLLYSDTILPQTVSVFQKNSKVPTNHSHGPCCLMIIYQVAAMNNSTLPFITFTQVTHHEKKKWTRITHLKQPTSGSSSPSMSLWSTPYIVWCLIAIFRHRPSTDGVSFPIKWVKYLQFTHADPCVLMAIY